MAFGNAQSPCQLAATARIFSPRVVRELASRGRSSLLGRLIKLTCCERTLSPTTPLGRLFDTAFDTLKRKDCRHEYVYKAALTHKILLGVHSLRTASLLTEFRACNAKADVVILNGTSTTYEIKSERDKLERLHAQVDAYRRVFASVNVVTADKHVREVVASVPSDVGVMTLTNRFRLSTVREAHNSPERTNPLDLLESMRRSEAIQILHYLGIDPPEVENTLMHQELKAIYSTLDPASAHGAMVRVLQQTRSTEALSDYIGSIPYSLRPAVISSRMNRRQFSTLAKSLETPLKSAAGWADC